LVGLSRQTELICEEMLRRDDLNSAKVSRSVVLETLGMVAVDDDRCLQLLAEARREASKEQRPIGELLVRELDQRLKRYRHSGVRRLFEEIQANHLDNPRVEQQLYQSLMSLGLITADGRVRLPAEPSERSSSGGLWTPAEGAEAVGGTAADSSGGSKLWIPGS
jgi:hypothetical protein